MDKTSLDRPTSYTMISGLGTPNALMSCEADAEPSHPFAGISRPSIDAMLDRNAKWFDTGCAAGTAGDGDLGLSQFVLVQASLLQAQALQRIAARLERKNWLVRLWQFLIWEPEVR